MSRPLAGQRPRDSAAHIAAFTRAQAASSTNSLSLQRTPAPVLQNPVEIKLQLSLLPALQRPAVSELQPPLELMLQLFPWSFCYLCLVPHPAVPRRRFFLAAGLQPDPQRSFAFASGLLPGPRRGLIFIPGHPRGISCLSCPKAICLGTALPLISPWSST